MLTWNFSESRHENACESNAQNAYLFYSIFEFEFNMTRSSGRISQGRVELHDTVFFALTMSPMFQVDNDITERIDVAFGQDRIACDGVGGTMV